MPCLTSVSWSSALPIGARKTRPASGALLTWRSRGTSPTWLTGRSWHCTDWRGGLNGDLVQYGVVARQVACDRRKRRVVKTEEAFIIAEETEMYLNRCVRIIHYLLWISCSHTCRAMARTAAWDCTSPWWNEDLRGQTTTQRTSKQSFCVRKHRRTQKKQN